MSHLLVISFAAQTDICKDPMDIYNYMHSQQVCSGLTLFYESWALLLENLGDCKKADEVYNLGIYRNAQPLERLIKQHRFDCTVIFTFSADNLSGEII